MTPSHVSQKVIVDRLTIITELLNDIWSLPLDQQASFLAERRNIWAAESCLRRSLEALLDIGRHILAKGFGIAVPEYKQIAIRLQEQQVLTSDEAALLFSMAGYRNRMVHFYHEITPDELYRICTQELGNIERVADGYRRWVSEHPDLVDTTL